MLETTIHEYQTSALTVSIRGARAKIKLGSADHLGVFELREAIEALSAAASNLEALGE